MKIIKQILKGIAYVVIGIILALCCYVLITTGVMKMSYADIFGYTYFQVKTGSMQGVIDVGDIIIVKLTNEYQTQDIITYQKEGEFITHRLIEIKNDEVITKGDVNSIEDEPVPKNQVLGKVVLIISTSFCLKILGILIILFIILTLLNFDTIFERWIMKDSYDSKKKSKKVTGNTMYIPVEDILKIQEEQKKEIAEPDKNIEMLDEMTIELLDDFTKELELAEVVNIKDQEFLNQVLNALQVKNKKCKTSKFDEKWIKKFCYIYKIMNLFLLDDQEELERTISSVPFDELYNYEFEEAGLTKKMQDCLYDMPFYVFIKLLITAMIYGDEEFFDAVFKIFKYRIKIDKNYLFTSLKKKTKYEKKQEIKIIKEQLKFMDTFCKTFDHKNILELDKIREYVKINSEISKMEGQDNE